MDNVDNSLEHETEKMLQKLVTQENGDVNEKVFFKMKAYQSINEKNLMTLPFLWLGKNAPNEIQRTWKKANGDTVGIRVISPSGVPSIFEFDILLALLKIYIQDNDDGFLIDKKTKECDISDKIHFSYRELCKTMGYKQYGGTIKKKLEQGIKRLTETTMYSQFSIVDASAKDVESRFRGTRSFRLIQNYIGYDKDKYFKMFGRELKASEIKDYQVIQLDPFIFENLKNSYFQVYNYDTYTSLKQGISKRLFLILSTWSKSTSKYIKYQTLYDYIGLDITDNKSRLSYNKMIKKALDELVGVGFIDSFQTKRGQGVNIVFNSLKNDTKLLKTSYTSENECVAKLREMGFEYEDIGKVIKQADLKYIAGLLRYIDARLSKGNTISNLKQYFLKCLKSKIDIDEYI